MTETAYRATFLHDVDVDYWKDRSKQPESYLGFGDVHRKYYFIVRVIKHVANQLGIDRIWHFYEPHVEITWVSDEHEAELLYDSIERILNQYSITDLKKSENREYMDWFCENEGEREFGAKRHALCSEFAKIVDDHIWDIRDGKGVKEQVKRTIHTLCNPLGINYTEEAKICFSRGLLCLLFRWFNFHWAVWIYTKIFRQKY